jgi:hypothetical protein
MDFLVTLVAAFLGSGTGAALVTWGMARDERKRLRRGTTADRARDRLGELDALYRGVYEGTADDSWLTQMEARVTVEIDKCGSRELAQRVDTWQQFGRRYASGELDAGEEEYRELFDGVRDELRRTVEDLS